MICCKNSKKKFEDGRKSEDKQVMLTDTGSRIESIDIESSEGSYKVISPEYK